MVFTRRHSSHVGAQNYREKSLVSCEFNSITMQNMSHNLLLFCAATWPSHHVIENHLYYQVYSTTSKKSRTIEVFKVRPALLKKRRVSE